jgi:hypothetical protein
MNYVTAFYDQEGTTLLFKEIDGILPIVLEQGMKITIDEVEAKVSQWEYHLKTKEQLFELHIFLRGKWTAPSMATLNLDPQMP